MQRRTLLKVGIVSSIGLALLGGAAASIQPGFERGALTSAGREVFRSICNGVLDKTLPEEAAARRAALDGLLNDIGVLLSALPAHAQAEVSQLLSILSTAAGRYGLAGQSMPWATAAPEQVQTALQNMRFSSVAVRQQAYGALHDIAAGAYFSKSENWAMLGYPGPLKI